MTTGRLPCGAFAVATMLLACGTARAEFPLRAEGALYEEVGEVQAAAWIERDRRRSRRSEHAQLDAVVIEGVELELSLERLGARDDEAGNARRLHAHEVELKWIPARRAHTWSLGVAIGRFAEGRERSTEVTLLASRRLGEDNRKALHLNLAREREREEDSKVHSTIFVAAYEHDLSARLALLAEVEASTRRKPLRHAGIRYRIARDLHFGAMAGRDAFGGVVRLGLLAEFD